uniref:Uncharacterized protein n=1 Tax=Ananas comosus var. bracteatus TaxID=296719 RepID=A0A6V7QM34_ANACO|nr:unnamed protein product [Ananas comosus var. bracteatus]
MPPLAPPPYRAASIPPLLLRSHLRHIASIPVPSLRFHLQSHLLPLMPLRSHPHPFDLGPVPSIPSVADLGCFCRRLDFVTILLKKGFFHAVCINCRIYIMRRGWFPSTLLKLFSPLTCFSYILRPYEFETVSFP